MECASRSVKDSKLAQVHGGLPVHGLVGEHEQFEDDALGHRYLVQLTELRCDSAALPGPSHNPSSMILDKLDFVKSGSWQPIQQRLAVVQPAAYEGVHQCLCKPPWSASCELH